MGSYIDYYLVKKNGEADFDKALELTSGEDDWDAQYYVEEMVSVLRDGELDPDDMTEVMEIDGETVWVFQYHNGIGDGGSHHIANSAWIAKDYPEAFKALGITVSWSKGPKVLAGQVDGTV